MPTAPADLAQGRQYELRVSRAAHGGEGIAIHDGVVVFIAGTYPGDVVQATITKVKKKFAKARLDTIITASSLRVGHRCPAAAAGAGCCDYSTLQPEAEAEFKTEILRGQLQRIGGLQHDLEINVVDMLPHQGWRTRVRLGVDATGHAGLRKPRSTEIITTQMCVQAVPGLFDEILGQSARRFTPNTELIVVLDDDNHRHIVEVGKPARGRRSEKLLRVVEGSDTVVQRSAKWIFQLPATAFWQAHKHALSHYHAQINTWCVADQPVVEHPVVWDLYGGVGALVPPVLSSLGDQVVVHSVEVAPDAATVGRKAFGDLVRFHTGEVEKTIPTLPKPQVVLLDPPRVGAGAAVIAQIAAAKPDRVIHIGCDPATFARDVKSWSEVGYELSSLSAFNAFPGTHHLETMGLLVPQGSVT